MPVSFPSRTYIALIAVTLLFPMFEARSLSRLRLRAELSSQQARLEVKNLRNIGREVNLRRSTLLLERANNGADFQLLARIDAPRGTPEVIDELSGPGLYSYRAKLILRRRGIYRSQRRSADAPSVIKSSILHLSITEQSAPQPPEIDSSEPALPPLAWPEIDANQSECPADHTAQALERINYHRAINGLAPVETLQVLQVAARLHAIKMARTQLLSHEGWFQTIWDLGFRGPHMSQNIANYIYAPYAVVDALMTSPGHMANILNSKDRHIGIGCVIDQNGKIWWAHNFGS